MIQRLVACLVLLAVATACNCHKPQSRPAKRAHEAVEAAGDSVWPRLLDVRRQLEELVTQRVSAGNFARRNGFVYAIDLSQLLAYAALRDQRLWYERLLQEASKAVVTRKVQGGAAATFVAWRHKPDPDPKQLEASGTTEALELARALWLGADRFNRSADRTLAIQLMQGYAQHQHTKDEVWLIRNYYNFQDDAFADNSYLVDYDPDFAAFVARQTDSSALCGLAIRSQRLVEQAATSAGLIHAVVNPGMLTLMPFAFYSPNNMEKLSNVAAVAERASGSNAKQAQAILAFAISQAFDLRLYYDAKTGHPLGEEYAGVSTSATLARLAAKLHDEAANERFVAMTLQKLPEILKGDQEDVMYLLGQALLALEFSARLHEQKPLPPAYQATADDCITFTR